MPCDGAPLVDLGGLCDGISVIRSCAPGGAARAIALPDLREGKPARLAVTWAPDIRGTASHAWLVEPAAMLGKALCLDPSAPPAGGTPLAIAGSLRTAGDLDGDGEIDLGLVRPPEGGDGAEVRVLFGGHGYEAPGLRIALPRAGLSADVRFVGDLDADGADELGIACWDPRDPDGIGAGLYILFGGALDGSITEIALEDILGRDLGVRIIGRDAAEPLSFCGGGDLLGDGGGDLAVASATYMAVLTWCDVWEMGTTFSLETAPCWPVHRMEWPELRLNRPPTLAGAVMAAGPDERGLLAAVPRASMAAAAQGLILSVPAEEIESATWEMPARALERFVDGRKGWSIGEALAPAGDFDGDGYEDVLTASRGPEGALEWILLFGGPGFLDGEREGAVCAPRRAVRFADRAMEHVSSRVFPGARIDGDPLSDLLLPVLADGELSTYIVRGGAWDPARIGKRSFRRGDVTADGRLDIADAISILMYLFAGGRSPSCLDAADTDDGGLLDLGDAVNLLQRLFAGGPPLPPPADCGPDTTPDDLDCGCYAPCASARASSG